MRRNFIFIKNSILPAAIFSLGLMVSAFIAVQAQTAGSSSAATVSVGGEQGITFPIPELGNCTSKDDCMNYCNAPDHMDACISFAKARGLMNGEEAARAQKFSSSLQSGGGPGGCKTPDECQNFCGKIENLDACLKFAKEHNLSVPDSAQAEKVLAYVKGGGKMPGGCDSKESCEAYCGDFNHADECLAFSEKSGLGPPPEAVGGKPMSLDDMKKMTALMKSGQTPGGCKSKEQCETYCDDSSHFEECISFAEKAGMVSPQDAAMARKTGGKGPGDCNSRESCDAYCNKPENREACFNFAKEHDLIPPEQLQNMKEGMTRLREGLAQAPPEVTACLTSTLGPNSIDDIQSGKLVPGPDIGNSIRDCFEKFGHRGDPGEVFKHAPPEALSCLKDKLGDKFEKISSGQEAPTPEMADVFRVCFQNVQLQGGFKNCVGACQGGPAGRSPDFPGGPPQGAGGPPPEMIASFLRTAPPEIAGCLKEKLGDEADKISSGQTPSQDDMEKVKECFQEFHPRGGPQMMPPQEFQGSSTMMRPQGGFSSAGMQQMEAQWNSFPAQVQNCLIEELGNDRITRIKQGQGTDEDQKEIPQTIQKCFQKQMQNFIPPSMPPFNQSGTPQQPFPGQNGTAPVPLAPPAPEFNSSQTAPFTQPPPPTTMPPGTSTQSPSSFMNGNNSLGALVSAFSPLVEPLLR